MPPIPGPRSASAKARPKPSTPRRERGDSSESSSARSATSPRSRVTNKDALRDQIARVYMVTGTLLHPFGRFYPAMSSIGDNLKSLSNEAADAWMELGAKDKRVFDWWESIVSASAVGNVVGVHFAIFASALPMGEYVQQVMSPDAAGIEQQLWEEGRRQGLSDTEIIEAIRLATGQVPPNMPARDMSTGGPGDTVRTGGEAMPTAQPTATGIVSPDQLGVTQPGQGGLFPSDISPPNGSGAVSA